MKNTEFLVYIRNLKDIGAKKKFKKNVHQLYEFAKSRGLSTNELNDVVELLITVDIDEKLFEQLILCMIPNDTVESSVIIKVIHWILLKYEHEDYVKVDNFLSWIAGLLDYHLVDENVIQEYYCLLWYLLENYPRAISHLMYILTKSGDVTFWRINFIQALLMKMGPEPYLCALLKRFKEVNSQFAYIIVPPFNAIKVFQVKNEFYKVLRATLKNKFLSDTISTASIVVPSQQKKWKIHNGLLPHVQYLQLNDQFDQAFIQDIKSGANFAKSFRKIILPSHTLSLLNNTMGIRILMFSDRKIQEQFMRNLYAVLEQSLISKQSVPTQEIETLLNNIIQLHYTYQQGFTALSSFLKLYLQSWDGVQYKKHVYKLIEWFVFKSDIEMNRFLLKPLYTLFVSSNAEDMCDILICLTNLLTNMYLAIEKCDGNFLYLFEENVLRSREELTVLVKSLTKFISKLFKIGLYIYSCNNQILMEAITFYEKINYLERLYDMPFWTVISSNVLYHCLFSFNAQLLEQIIKLYQRYQSMEMLPIEKSTQKMQEKVNLLRNYFRDVYNFLWSSRAFVDRITGHVLRDLSLEDEAEWKNYVNLNNALNLERHVMFVPYRMIDMMETSTSSQLLSKENVLDVLKSPMPYLVKIITEMVQEKLIEDGNEFV